MIFFLLNFKISASGFAKASVCLEIFSKLYNIFSKDLSASFFFVFFFQNNEI